MDMDYGIRIYKTKVDMTKANDYILGRISGIMCVVTKDDPASRVGYSIKEIKEIDEEASERIISAYLRTLTTANFYENFKTIVEKLYPGICEFDVK